MSLGKRVPASDSIEPLDFEALYRENVEKVARWAARLGGTQVDVDDVVQEVFVAVHRQLSSFRGESRISTWLYRITANQVIERRRRDRFRRWLGLGREVTQIAAPGLSPVEALERREVAERVYRALDRMSERYRQLIILFELERLSGQEIAELTGMNLDSVWVGLHRARAQLHKQLMREGDAA